jgi:hypothetical protein
MTTEMSLVTNPTVPHFQWQLHFDGKGTVRASTRRLLGIHQKFISRTAGYESDNCYHYVSSTVLLSPRGTAVEGKAG